MNTTQAPSLPRVLGPITAAALVVGTVIGSGVFKKPQDISTSIEETGLIALVWVLGGLLVLFGALAYAEVASLHPHAGGNYVFLREAYGRLAGFLWGWVEFWIIRTASLAALASVFTESLAAIMKDLLRVELGFWPQLLVTLIVLAALGWINIRGVRWGGGLQVVVTAVKVLSLVSIALLPYVVWILISSPQTHGSLPTTANLAPVWPASFTSIDPTKIATAFLAVLWAYHGWMNIAPIAGEVRDPQRNIPLALLLGTGVVVALYLSVNLAYHLTIPTSELKGMIQPPVAVIFAGRLIGSIGTLLASLAIMMSVFGSLNGNIMVGPRLLFAMGQDGLAPKALQAIHPRYHTPALAIAVLTVWACIQVVVVGILNATEMITLRSPFDTFTDFAMFGAVIFETMAVLSIFVFRRTMPDAPRPYRCPGYPWVPLLYALIPVFVLGNMFIARQLEAAVGMGFIVVGTMTYFALGLGRGHSAGSLEHN